MKTKHYLIIGALAIIGITSFVACEKSDIAPSQVTSEITAKKGKPITVPCPANYPEVVLPAADWHINADTSVCGRLTLTWDAQPGFTGLYDQCYALSGKYFLQAAPVVPDSVSQGCGGISTSLTGYWYVYGNGCMFWPGQKEYTVYLSWYEYDDVNQKVYKHTAIPTVIKTGTKGIWACP